MIDATLVYLGYGQILSHRLRSSGSTFMYLVHLITIDLELSRSFNTHTCTVTLIAKGLFIGVVIYRLSIYRTRSRTSC